MAGSVKTQRPKPLIYVSVPIDFASDEVQFPFWDDTDVVFYNPAAAFVNAKLNAASVISINHAGVGQADGMFAYLPAGTPSVGVPIEIYIANSLGTPIAVMGGQGSLVLDGFDSVQTFPEGKEQAAWDWLKGRVSIEFECGPFDAIRYMKTYDDARAPTQGHLGDAGFDLTTMEDAVVHEGRFADIPCGMKIELPDGVWGLIMGRSSTLRDRGLMVIPGIIDQGYRGELFVGVWNLSKSMRRVEKGARLAQLIPMPLMAQGFGWVESVLSDSPRGASGFGSTGP